MGLATRLNLIWVLIWMNFMPKSNRDSLKLFWVFAEPAGQLMILMLVFNLIGRTAGYGPSFALFMMTGVVMLNLFNSGSQKVMVAVVQSRNRARLPGVGLLHAPVAQAIFQIIVAIGYTSVLTYAVGVYEHVETMPQHFDLVAEAFFWAGLMSFGVGLCRAYVSEYAPGVHKVYSIAMRAMIFISGIFYVPSFMPPQIRDWLAWNPVLQTIERFRMGMYDQYPTIVYAPTYLMFWALGSTALGLSLVFLSRRRFMG